MPCLLQYNFSSSADAILESNLPRIANLANRAPIIRRTWNLLTSSTATLQSWPDNNSTLRVAKITQGANFVFGQHIRQTPRPRKYQVGFTLLLTRKDPTGSFLALCFRTICISYGAGSATTFCCNVTAVCANSLPLTVVPVLMVIPFAASMTPSK